MKVYFGLFYCNGLLLEIEVRDPEIMFIIKPKKIFWFFFSFRSKNGCFYLQHNRNQLCYSIAFIG